jgi:hypothetical protein
MKKGLNVTLMTVAIAVMAFQAMAMAPTIGDIKSPIVGNEPGATSATPWIYPEAFDINSKATDDTTSSANIRWSYDYAGTEVYRINNVDRVVVSDATINNPGAARINGTTTDPADVDASAATITIRNVKYRPIGGSDSEPIGTGIIDAIPVTLFASDGTTYSQTEVFFYTEVGGTDRLSQGATQWTPVASQTAFPTGGGLSWTYSPVAGTITSSTSGGTAVCMDAALTGVNFSEWRGSWGAFSVAKNTVYRIRARINGSQATAGHTPFMDIYLSNFSSDGLSGMNMYGGDLMIFDNEGGANAPISKPSTNGTTYQWFWAPPCLNNAAYNNDTTIWASGNAENRKMMLVFRVLDVNSINGSDVLTADVDSGSLCLNDLQIDSIPSSGLVAASTSYTSPATMTTSNMQVSGIFGQETFQSDGVLIAPSTDTSGAVGDSRYLEYGSGQPGDATIDYGTPSTMSDNYPVTWESDTLYQIAWQWSAMDATSANGPPDAIVVGMDTPMNEFIVNSYVSSQGGLVGMPKTGTPQDYICYFYSHSVSASATSQFRTFRPRVEWLNSPLLIGSPSNGSFKLHGCTVKKLTVPN